MKDVFEGTGNCHAGDGYKVVTTGMSDPREGIHFRVNADGAASCAVAELGFPSGWEEKVLGNLETLFREERCEHIMRMAVAISWIGVSSSGNRDSFEGDNGIGPRTTLRISTLDDLGNVQSCES